MDQSVKKWVITGAGFGAGAGLMLAIVMGGWTWYASRPKSWKTDALACTYSTALVTVNDSFDISLLEAEYVVENKTANDYTLSPEHTFMVVDDHGMGPSSGRYKLTQACFIPAGNKVKCDVTLPVDYDTSFPEKGFIVFDSMSRYKIIFPKPLRPTPDEKKKDAEIFKKMKQNPQLNK